MTISEKCSCGAEFTTTVDGTWAADWEVRAAAEWRKGHQHQTTMPQTTTLKLDPAEVAQIVKAGQSKLDRR